MPSFERAVLVTNPNSSRSTSVERDVIDPLRKANLPFTHIETEFADRQLNIDDLSSKFRAHDRIVIASGDGVVNQAASALLERDIETYTELGALPFGNFCDNAKAHTKPGATAIDFFGTNHTTKLRPLELLVDNAHVLWGLQYITGGWTAKIAEHMSNPEFRSMLSSDKTRIVRSMASVAMRYPLKYRHRLPTFQREADGAIHHDVTDLIAMNGPSMGRIFSDPRTFSDTYLSQELHTNHAAVDDLKFLATALFNFIRPRHRKMQLPGTERSSEVLHFLENGTVPVQADGEVQMLTNPQRIEIHKSSRELSMLTGR